MRRYVILEVGQSTRLDGMRSGSRSGGVGGAGFRAGAQTPSPVVRTENLSDTDVGDARRNPRLTIAPVMATSLIRPLGSGADADADAEDAWGVAAVGADASPWNGKGCVVAVLDTGIEVDHPAFAGMELVSKDFSGDGDGDRVGHGTHCAGTMFGRDVEGRRIGIARGVSRALVGKVLGDDGGGTSEMIFAGLQWAVEQNADIVSLSLGLDFPGQVATLTRDGWPADLATSVALEAYRENLRLFDRWMDLLKAQAAFRRIPLVIAAAGNESRRDLAGNHRIGASLPAAATGVISVGALLKDVGLGYGIAPFSNTLPTVCAPGVDILSADLDGGLRLDSGTSMAGPHVAGVAALWFESLASRGFAVRPEDIEAQLRARASTDRLSKGIEFEDCGLGLVSAPSNPR